MDNGTNLTNFLLNNVSGLEGDQVKVKTTKGKKVPTFLPCKATHYHNRVQTLLKNISETREGVIKDHGGDLQDLTIAFQDAVKSLETLQTLLFLKSSLNKGE